MITPFNGWKQLNLLLAIVINCGFLALSKMSRVAATAIDIHRHLIIKYMVNYTEKIHFQFNYTQTDVSCGSNTSAHTYPSISKFEDHRHPWRKLQLLISLIGLIKNTWTKEIKCCEYVSLPFTTMIRLETVKVLQHWPQV